MSENMTNLSWDDCSNEVLSEIFKKLEDASLLICLQVNEHWKAVAYNMLTKQREGLEQTIINALEDIGYLYKKKPQVNCHDSYLNSLLWYNVSNATIKYSGSLGKKVKYMSTYRGYLIVVDDYGVTYYNMENYDFRHRLSINCLTFDDSENLVVITGHHETETTILTVFGKQADNLLSPENILCETSVIVFRIIEDKCYIVDNEGYIICIEKNENGAFVENDIGRFHGCVNLIISMHVTSNGFAYVMLKSGVIIRCNKMGEGTSHDCTSACAYKPYDDDLYTKSPLGMMFQFGAFIEVGPNDEFTVHYNEAKKSLSILCPRLVCACHHGNVLLTGYSDGKIDIFIKRKLEKGNLIPERTIDVYDFYPGPVYSEHRHIRQIRIYETFGSHVLCIITDSVTVKLLVQNLELINSDAQAVNADELCLSLIHLLNIQL